MNRNIVCRRLAFALTAILGMGSPALAGDSLPFHGFGTEVITGGSGNVLSTDGEGVATHLGHFTRHLDVTVNEDYTLDGHLVFTAAYGDKLCIHLTGSFITLSGDYTIIGGTGRFANASGSAAFAATMNGGVISFSFDGTIQY